MASNTSSASCAQAPLSLLVGKPSTPIPPKQEEETKIASIISSSPGSNGKPFTPSARQKLRECLSSSGSAVVSSVDDHTPPTDPPKPKTIRKLAPRTKHKAKIVPRVYKKVQRAAPAGAATDLEFPQIPTDAISDLNLPPNNLSRAMRETWARFPPPSNKEFPLNEEFNFTPKYLAKSIEPEAVVKLGKQRSEANFVQPLAMQGDIRNQYAAHIEYNRQDHDELMKRVTTTRRERAEKNAALFLEPNETDMPTEFPIISPKIQKVIYKEKAKMSEMSRKVAICDGAIEGIIAGEFTYHKDTAHLPPTEDQMAVLREAEGLKPLFKRAPTDLPPYDKWLKDQASTACPPSQKLTYQEELAKKKAFRSALTEQLESRFPSKPIKNQLPTKAEKCVDLVEEKGYFPYLLPKTENGPNRYSMYETPIEVQVPKWFPAFVESNIIPIDRNQTTEKQYKELTTTIWKLESQMHKKSRPGQWDQNWHEENPHWTQPRHQTSGG